MTDYRCECDPGFSGENCTIEDECITQTVACVNGAQCSDNTTHPWQCNCVEECDQA